MLNVHKDDALTISLNGFFLTNWKPNSYNYKSI